MKTSEQIKEYESAKSDFSDFPRFEGKNERRKAEKKAFIENREYAPNYDYPKLDELVYDEKLVQKKRVIYEAVMELEAAKENPESNQAELELYASYHEMRLKKIMLVEAARNLKNCTSSAEMEVCRNKFAELNEVVYGELDRGIYLGMLNTERERVSNFEPKSELAQSVKTSLKTFLGHIDTEGSSEEKLVDDETINKLHDYVLKRYANVLDVVPDTPDDIYYDINGCSEIMNKALQAGGLFDMGWTAVENPFKTVNSTNKAKKVINLTSNILRNSQELRRLILHEQEVHARRAHKGEESGLGILYNGTADYTEVEEGFAVMMECAVAGNFNNLSFDRARIRYITAGLALGADGTPRDARETFEVLWRIISVQNSSDGNITQKNIDKAKDQAYVHIENAYRGTQFWMKGVIYTKLKTYYEGFVKISNVINENIDNLDQLFDDVFVGKYDFTNPEEKELIMNILNSRKADNNE